MTPPRAIYRQPPDPEPDGVPVTEAHEDRVTLASRPSSRPRVVAAVLGGVLLVALTTGMVRRLRHDSQLRAEAASLASERVPVRVATPRRAPANVDTTLPGSVEALQETTVYARVSGYVKRWLVDIGDVVKEGQLLAEIDTPELEQQLAQARASLAQAKAGLAQASANAELARVTANRYEKLTPAGVTSQQDVDDKRAGLDVAVANVAAAEAAIKSGEANVQRLVALKEFQRVVAPFDGIVTARPTEVGQMVTASTGQGQALFRVAKVDPIRVFIHVPQTWAPSVRVGQEAKLGIREYPNRTFVGKVTRMAKALDMGTRTMLTEVDVPNEDRALFPGMYAQVTLATAGMEGALLVPSTALIVSSQGTQVAVVDASDRIHFQDIQVDADYGTEIAVAIGLKGDERIVVNPGERIAEGLAVSVGDTAAPESRP
jgi:RND family efflux transporter MFP subunit